MSALKQEETDQFRSLLLDLQARVRGDVEQLTGGALDRGEGNSETRSPTHLADIGTDAYEQEFSLQFAQNDQEVLEQITSALKRIEDGTFGLCEGCLAEGKSIAKSRIPKTRLRAIPYARNCIECERKREELT